jgi:hypothetical protein
LTIYRAAYQIVSTIVITAALNSTLLSHNRKSKTFSIVETHRTTDIIVTTFFITQHIEDSLTCGQILINPTIRLACGSRHAHAAHRYPIRKRTGATTDLIGLLQTEATTRSAAKAEVNTAITSGGIALGVRDTSATLANAALGSICTSIGGKIAGVGATSGVIILGALLTDARITGRLAGDM